MGILQLLSRKKNDEPELEIRSEGEDRTEWHVRPDFEARDFSLTFRSRSAARDYKRLLAKSFYHIQSKIIRRDWQGGFIRDEKEVR